MITVVHSEEMIELIKSATFNSWLDRLRDVRAKARIEMRLVRLGNGNPGDVRPVGSGVSEMRIDYGPGYRVYFITRGDITAILLCGGDKVSQTADIDLAKKLAADWSG